MSLNDETVENITKQAGAELGQALLQLELGFTLLKVCCITFLEAVASLGLVVSLSQSVSQSRTFKRNEKMSFAKGSIREGFKN